MNDLLNIISCINNFDDFKKVVSEITPQQVNSLIEDNDKDFTKQYNDILRKKKKFISVCFYRLFPAKIDAIRKEYNFVYERMGKMHNALWNAEYRLADIKDNIEKYQEMYQIMEDSLSKKTLINILLYRLTLCPTLTCSVAELAAKEGPQYFDKIVCCNKEEVFVDCGGYTGDTIMQYIKCYGKEYKTMYTYEPDAANWQKAKENLRGLPNIVFRPCGVGVKSGTVTFSPAGISGRFSEQNEQNGVEIVSLDQDIHEPVTFIKMDIEGMELAALQGVQNHIKQDKPKLAISVYHKLEDILVLTQYIRSFKINYKYYLRHYTFGQWDTILYCIPECD